MVQTPKTKATILILDPCACCAIGTAHVLREYDTYHSTSMDTRVLGYDLVILESDFDSLGDGLLAAGRVRDKSDGAVLFFTHNCIPSIKARALALGVRGWVEKKSPPQYLLECVKRTLEGEYVWTAKQRAQVSGAIKESACCGVRFTPAQRRVLKQMTLGFSNSGLAKILGLSVLTVDKTVQMITKRTGLDRMNTIIWAIKQGLDED